MKKITLVMSFAFIILIPSLAAQTEIPDSSYLRQYYSKHEYLIPMRDGIRLFTSVYSPKDTSKPHPIIIIRTPYSCFPYGEDDYKKFQDAQGSYFMRRGYIMVTQDVRGRYMSEGDFEDVRPYKPLKKSEQRD